MKDIDFLPEWYKEGHRHRVHMRHQYAALVCVVLAMICYNVTATHRINQASAAIDGMDDQRRMAEQVTYEFDATNRLFRERQAKVDLVAQMDSKIDVGAVLAELSHIITGRVVLSRLEFISEVIAVAKDKAQGGKTPAVRPVSGGAATKSVALGDVRFRIVIGGVAESPADVGALACLLEESPYFKQVYPSVSRSGKIEMTVASPSTSGGSSVNPAAGQGREVLHGSEFEITCYLANYEEVKGR